MEGIIGTEHAAQTTTGIECLLPSISGKFNSVIRDCLVNFSVFYTGAAKEEKY
jgi:hypothetical protein